MQSPTSSRACPRHRAISSRRSLRPEDARWGCWQCGRALPTGLWRGADLLRRPFINLQNDPQHCGACGAECDAGTFCTGGHCLTPPCETTCGAGSSCCGAECCKPNQLCCDPQGPIEIAPRCLEPNEHGTCPPGCAPLCMCAAPDTPIATPAGERALASLAPGDLVYSVDGGTLTVVPIARVQHTPLARHRVMRIALSSGRVLLVSPGHPTADGRSFGALMAGDQLDGVTISSAALVPYQFDATYDILPESDTGAYFAAGVLVGSTLACGKQLVRFSGAGLRSLHTPAHAPLRLHEFPPAR